MRWFSLLVAVEEETVRAYSQDGWHNPPRMPNENVEKPNLGLFDCQPTFSRMSVPYLLIPF
ncbi:MAG: hypothetical protein JKY88_12390, partial [Pseudomonadales bacterium]|nr:hypothetical protein [Pseudomonadales bacterium]